MGNSPDDKIKDLKKKAEKIIAYKSGWTKNHLLTIIERQFWRFMPTRLYLKYRIMDSLWIELEKLKKTG